MTQEEHSPNGNTSKRIRARGWFFTFNNYDSTDIDTLLSYFSNAKKYVFQEEKGESETPHLQGFVYWDNAKNFDTLKKINVKIHWEVTRNMEAAAKYCQKEETNNGKRWIKGFPKLLKLDLKDWQNKLLIDLSLEPDNRKIIWFVDEQGGAGKTTFCKYLLQRNEDYIYVTGKAADMKYAISERINEGKDIKCILIDYTRSTELYVSYQGIEEIKNGLFFSTKYKSGQTIFDTPHVVIFSNFLPDKEKLSEDRWDIRLL